MDSELSWRSTVKDLIAGTIGGVGGIIAGQPFDTVKVRLQTQQKIAGKPMYNNLRDCFFKIGKQEGIRSFYKGMVSPMVANAPINAILFAVYGGMIRHFYERVENITPLHHFYAGCVSGLVQTTISAPSELVKILLQVQRGAKNPLYTGPIGCIKHLVKHEGIKSLTRGFGITVLRDTPSFGGYFMSYECCKQWFIRRQKTPGPLSPFALLTSGGLAGTFSWMILHPIDVVKSCKQATSDLLPKSERSITHIISSNYKKEGVKFFFRGYVPTIMRAYPASAVVFLLYEVCMNGLNEMF